MNSDILALEAKKITGSAVDQQTLISAFEKLTNKLKIDPSLKHIKGKAA
ncbi:hypothetical protein [Roseovarius mucosus]|nr:hypothetical protein [Roseovarius mucosus]